MLPSRGVCRVCRAKAGNTEWSSPLQSAKRQFSSRPARSPPTYSYGRSQPGLYVAQTFKPALFRHHDTSARSPLSSISQLSQIRFQSTSPAEPLGVPLPPVDYPAASTELLSDAHLDGSGGSTGEWAVGYLREMGLDFGWGPTSCLQWIFEHLHVYSGTTIGGTILLTAVLIRVCTFPAVIGAQDTAARLNALGSITKPIQARMREAAVAQDQMELQRARQEMAQLYRGAQIKLWKSFMPLVQIPIGFGLWRLTRNMADVGVPGMETGGFWWFQNLCVPDPYFILPIATGLIQHISMRMGGEMGTTEASKKMRAIFIWVLPIMAPIFIGLAPAAVQISFCTASILSFGTTTLLRQPAVRRLFKVPPRIIPQTPSAGPQTPYKGTINVSGRATSHPSAGKTANESTAKRSGPVGSLNRFKPSNIKAGVGEMWKTATDFVGDVMPQAQKTATSRKEKAVKNRAEEYETKRRKEIEKEKFGSRDRGRVKKR